MQGRVASPVLAARRKCPTNDEENEEAGAAQMQAGGWAGGTCALGSAPRSSRTRMGCSLPLMAQMARGVLPSASAALTTPGRLWGGNCWTSSSTELAFPAKKAEKSTHYLKNNT